MGICYYIVTDNIILIVNVKINFFTYGDITFTP